MAFEVSIVISTCNRVEDLRATLGSFNGLNVPADLPTELLVVDNSSTDGTAEVIKSASLQKVPVRYLYEPRPGKCIALNSALANTSGEIILFTDDDVRVPRDWIVEMARPILGGAADAVAGGVKMAPHLRKKWMTPQTPARPADNSDIAPSESIHFMGANMAFARRVLAKVPGFDDEMGPGALGFGDETLFEMQLRTAGFRIVGAMQVQVEHHFASDRLTRRNLLRMAKSVGRSIAYSRYHWYHQSADGSNVKAMCKWLQLVLFRATHPQVLWQKEGLTETEFELVKSFHRHWHLVREARRLRNYDYRGLVKLQK